MLLLLIASKRKENERNEDGRIRIVFNKKGDRDDAGTKANNYVK